MLKFFTFRLLAALAGYGVYAFAQPRVDARTAVTPIASSPRPASHSPGFTVRRIERCTFAVSALGAGRLQTENDTALE